MHRKFFVVTLAAVLLLDSLCTAQSTPPQPAPGPAFDDRAASTLLRQLSESLQGHSQRKFFSLFDLAQMKDGPLFKEQISSFFSRAESIRAHLNLVAISTENQAPRMAVDAEMEVQPGNGGPESHQAERLTFTVAHTARGWKFIDVAPRPFFSLP